MNWYNRFWKCGTYRDCGLCWSLRWSLTQIKEFLKCDNLDARKVAALSLALVGGKCCLGPLAELLRDPDPIVNEMAEHSLWSIWFRSGKVAEANHELCRGTKALNRREFDEAIAHFSRAIDSDPSFAEAYNQRAIGYYLKERYDDSIADCLQTVERMPCHFGAWSGMGHCHAHCGRIAQAIESYEEALKINPHLNAVRQVITELRCELDRR